MISFMVKSEPKTKSCDLQNSYQSQHYTTQHHLHTPVTTTHQLNNVPNSRAIRDITNTLDTYKKNPLGCLLKAATQIMP